MKIAVLMVGRIAGFERCYKSHHDYIFQNNQTDVYLAHNSNNINDNLDLFKKTYSLKKSISLHVDISEFERYTIPSNIGVHGRNCVIMFRCINEGFKLINPDLYDIVMYMRADELLTSRLHFDTPQENTVYIPIGNDHAGGINDQFAYGNYESMKKYCSTIENLHMFLSKKRVIFHPENINRYNLEYNKLNIRRVQLEYTIFRTVHNNTPVKSISILNTIRKIKSS